MAGSDGRGRYVRRNDRKDKDAMRRDLDEAWSLVKLKAELSYASFERLYAELQKEKGSYFRDISFDHATTLMRIATTFHDLPANSAGLTGFARLLGCMTLTGAKELTGRTLSASQLLRIVEAVEAGVLSPRFSVLRVFVQSLRKGSSFGSLLNKYGTTSPLPPARASSNGRTPQGTAEHLQRIYRAADDLAQFAERLSYEAELFKEELRRFAAAGNVKLSPPMAHLTTEGPTDEYSTAEQEASRL